MSLEFMREKKWQTAFGNGRIRAKIRLPMLNAQTISKVNDDFKVSINQHYSGLFRLLLFIILNT